VIFDTKNPTHFPMEVFDAKEQHCRFQDYDETPAPDGITQM
jgi:hypothetical protein